MFLVSFSKAPSAAACLDYRSKRKSTTRTRREEGPLRRNEGAPGVARAPCSHRNAASVGIPRPLEADENADEGKEGEDASRQGALPRPHAAVGAPGCAAAVKGPHRFRSAVVAVRTVRCRRWPLRTRRRRASALGNAPGKLDDGPDCGRMPELRADVPSRGYRISKFFIFLPPSPCVEPLFAYIIGRTKVHVNT